MTRINPVPKKPHDGQALFDRLTRKAALLRAWDRVADNAGAAGGDGETCQRFAQAADQRVKDLARALRDGSYVPGPCREVTIPKASGGERRLVIPCVTDRVAQTAVAQALGPLLEQEFEDVSFGYRPGRSVRDALKAVKRLRDDGFDWTVDADIEAYFDSVPHDLMMERLTRSVSESALTSLIHLWLDTACPSGRGLPQGSPLSPLLANLYLDQMDEALLKRDMRLVRYADDFVVLVKSRKRAEAVLDMLQEVLASLGLSLHPAKTRIRSFEESTRFLGAVFMRSFMLGDAGPAFDADATRLLARLAVDDEANAERLAEADARRDGEEKAGYHANLRVLYAQSSGLDVDLVNQAFGVSQDGETLAVVHPTRLDRIEIGPGVTVSTGALKQALGHGIPVDFVNGWGESIGHLTPALSSRGHRQLRQAALCLDEDRRLALARILVDCRLRNQRALLRRINQRRLNGEVSKRAIAVGRHVRLAAHADTVDALRGHEGAGAAHFWKGFALLLMHGWTMTERQRPARDGVNCVLNVACGLLARDIGIALDRAGLNRSFGAVHATSDGRQAGVFDLMEVFRSPLTESVALDLINTRMIRPEHVERIDRKPHLVREGYEAVVRGYEERVAYLVRAPGAGGEKMTWRGLMQHQADALAAHVEGRADFRPYLMDY